MNARIVSKHSLFQDGIKIRFPWIVITLAGSPLSEFRWQRWSAFRFTTPCQFLILGPIKEVKAKTKAPIDESGSSRFIRHSVNSRRRMACFWQWWISVTVSCILCSFTLLILRQTSFIGLYLCGTNKFMFVFPVLAFSLNVIIQGRHTEQTTFPVQ